jgi:FKBP-type peptidyl-prolyl cis-trans isomerase
MKRLVLIIVLALGLAACGNGNQQATDHGDADDMAATTSESQSTDMTSDESAAQQSDAAMQEDQAAAFAEMQQQFLADYAQQDGVTTTDSGLMYKVITPGDGASPDANDVVEVHYEGRLTDGTVFDSSYERGETIEFPLNRVIPGWTEGLQLMQEGSKYEFVIPPELGYGSRGAGDVIPPNAVLIFDVELFHVTPVE